jgi:hypothetical protein
MNLSDLSARALRLDQLSRGLAKEVILWKACNAPLLYLERKAYLAAIQNAAKKTGRGSIRRNRTEPRPLFSSFQRFGIDLAENPHKIRRVSEETPVLPNI